MDDQQGRQLSEDYIAGLITGEGWFGFQTFRRRHGHLVIRPALALGMKDKETMELLFETAKRMGLPFYRYDRGRDGYRLVVVGMKRLSRWLEVFLPRLTGDKRRAAECIARFIASRLGQPRSAPFSEYELALVRQNREGNSGKGRPAMNVWD